MLKQMTIEPTEVDILNWVYGRYPLCCPIKAGASRQLGLPPNCITVSSQAFGIIDPPTLNLSERARLSVVAREFVNRIDNLPPAMTVPAEVMAELLRPFPAFDPEDVDAV